MISLPTESQSNAILTGLSELISAMKDHPTWKQSRPDPTMVAIWDFAEHTRKKLTDLPKLVQEKGTKAAEEQYTDVLSRSIFMEKLINDAGTLSQIPGRDTTEPFEFGEQVMQKLKQLNESLPE